MRFSLTLLLVVFIAVACGDPAAVSTDASQAADATPAASEMAAEPTDDSAEESADEGAAMVSVADSDLGAILVDGEGNTLYLLTGDEQGESTCYDDCETNWPVLQAPVEAGEGGDAALLGETEREDGTLQATYNDWPLYYFAGDAQAGDVNGQGVGGVWYVVDASGEPVKDGGGGDRPRDY